MLYEIDVKIWVEADSPEEANACLDHTLTNMLGGAIESFEIDSVEDN